MAGYAFMPKNAAPFITRMKELPRREPSEDYMAMRRFFATHDIVDTRNPETGELEFKAVPKDGV